MKYSPRIFRTNVSLSVSNSTSYVSSSDDVKLKMVRFPEVVSKTTLRVKRGKTLVPNSLSHSTTLSFPFFHKTSVKDLGFDGDKVTFSFTTPYVGGVSQLMKSRREKKIA